MGVGSSPTRAVAMSTSGGGGEVEADSMSWWEVVVVVVFGEVFSSRLAMVGGWMNGMVGEAGDGWS